MQLVKLGIQLLSMYKCMKMVFLYLTYKEISNGWQEIPQVIENSERTLRFNIGLGYTIVWREHFAVEPFMNLTFMNGEAKIYDETSNYINTSDLSGTNFNLGVNFSLFF